MAARKGTRKKKSANAPAPTFDDALAMLVQLDPENMDAFRQFSEMLQAVCSDRSLDDIVIKSVAAAKEQIDLLVLGEVTDVEDVLVEASRLLEAATKARDAALLTLNGGVPAPAPIAAEPAPAQVQQKHEPKAATTEKMRENELPASRVEEPLPENVRETLPADTHWHGIPAQRVGEKGTKLQH